MPESSRSEPQVKSKISRRLRLWKNSFTPGRRSEGITVAATVLPKPRIWTSPQKHHEATDQHHHKAQSPFLARRWARRTTIRCRIVSSIVTKAYARLFRTFYRLGTSTPDL